MQNTLFYGDNLKHLRDNLPDESVDLIYLDPPFNSARNYNLLFKQVKGGILKADDVRAFGHVIEQHKALFGLLITLNEPTKGMKQDAEAKGFVEDFGTMKIPKLQILTVRELLEEKKRFALPQGYIPTRNQGIGKAKVPSAVRDLFAAVEEEAG